MALKVIGTGLPRTGTASLKGALQLLGYQQTYHMDNLLNNPSQVHYWVELFDTGSTDYDALFEGFAASTDFPGFFAYKALLKQYPDSKFILTTRDPDIWYESIKNTVYQAVTAFFQKDTPTDSMRRVEGVFQLLDRYLFGQFFKGTFLDKEKTLSLVNAYLDEINAIIPADKMLIYEISEGWQPLCDFLELRVPEIEFPYKNKREDFNTMIAKMLSGQKMEVK